MSRTKQELLSIFSHAVDLNTAEEVAAFLDEACADDADFRSEVEALLSNHDTAGGFLGGIAQPATDDELLGSTIGPYKLREILGQGGMGNVYVAEQTEPVRRKVALKIIRQDITDRNVIARFEAERQALAMMDHPNIARVYDGGTTDRGQPYFVMELVQGLPITEFCDQHRLSTRKRLALFVNVCQAVQHAHQRGIIHRDLKPSNVIVAEIDGTPVAKVIDFGIAKAVNQTIAEHTVYTHISQMVGTPLYMSPEQTLLGVIDVDTRSDVYSLGVLLYELLAGSTPFQRDELKQAGFDEMRRIIREDDPPPPSTRVSTLSDNALSTVSERRSSEPRKLRASLSGELDWLVMKALEKDRNRRYQSASALAEDTERFLSGAPIEACPPSVVYRTRKFVRRHRLAVASTSAVVLALLLGLAGTTWQAVRATAEMHRADREAVAAQVEASISNAVLEFVQTDLLSHSDPHVEPDPDLTVRAVLDRAAQSVDRRFADQPKVEATISATLAKAYHGLGDYSTAEKFYERALELQREQFGADTSESLETELQQAWLRHDLGDWQGARTALEENVKRCQEQLGDEHMLTQRTQTYLADVLRHLAQYSEAEDMARRALVLNRKYLGDHHVETIKTMNILALCYSDQNHEEQCAELLREARSAAETDLGGSHPTTLAVKQNLATSLGALSRHDESVELLREVVNESRRVLGPDHPETLIATGNLARELKESGQPEEATRMQRELLATCNNVLGLEHPTTRVLSHNLAISLAEQGDLVAAQEMMEAGLALDCRITGLDHPSITSSLNNLRTTVSRRASVANERQGYAEVEQLERQLFETQQRLFGEEHVVMNDARRRLGEGLGYLSWIKATAAVDTQDAQQAVELAREAEQLEPNQRYSTKGLGVALYRLGQWQAAIDTLQAVDESSDECKCHRMIQAMAHWQLGHHAIARRLLGEGIVWHDANRDELASLKNMAWVDRVRSEAETMIRPATDDASVD